MAPTSRIYLTRHAQAMHNVSEDTTISDAVLTPLGHQQAARLATLTPEIQSVAEVIISSPLRRTLQTTAAGYAPAIERLGGHANIVCLPQLQECSHNPCDTGSAREILESHPEFSKYNLSLLTPEWISKKDFYASDAAALQARAQWVRQYLRDRKEEYIVIMAHGDFLRCLTGQPDSYWGNAEVRLFQFDPEHVTTEQCPLMQVDMIATGDWQGEPTAQAVQEAQASLEAMEQRVKKIQASLASQTNELEELDRRLAEADRKQVELENHLA